MNFSSKGFKQLFAVILFTAILGITYANWQPRAPEVVFTDLNGAKISSASLRGKVVMINFWATTCVYCVQEMPQLIATYHKYKAQNFAYIGVTMQYDPPNYVLDFVQSRQLPFPVVLDVTGNLAKSFGDVALTPTTLIIGKNGAIIKRFEGVPEFVELHRLLDKALRA